MGTYAQKHGNRLLYHWLIVIAFPLLLAACAGPTTPGGGSQAVTLKIMDYSPEQVKFHTLVAAEYHKLHPNVTIQWQSIAQAQYLQALPLAFQSHQAADIIYWANGVVSMSQLLSQGWIHPLSPDGKVPQDWMARWPANTFQEGINVHNGEIYGFPFTDNIIWGPGYMYYNKAIFQDAGLTQPPTTWSQLKSDCESIKAKTGKYCLSVPLKGVDFQRIWYALAGKSMTNSFFDYKTGQYDLTEPRMLKAFSFIQSLYQEQLAIPGVNDKAISRQQMAAGQAAIYFDGSWMPTTFTQLNFAYPAYGVAQAPAPDDGPIGALSIQNTENKYWVSSQTTHAQEAWDFIQWMTQPGGFFARGYLNSGFGTLAFTDNAKDLTDPGEKAVVDASKGLRVNYPEPLLQCPDLAKSQAFTKSATTHPNWEWEVMVDALVNHKDLAPLAQQVVNGRQQILDQGLQQDQTKGLKVSKSCYTFSNWDYNQNFDPANYPKA